MLLYMHEKKNNDPKSVKTDKAAQDDRLKRFMEKTGYRAEPVVYPFPMKWHEFQIILLLVDAIYIVMNGLAYATGAWLNQYGNYAEQVYQEYPTLKMCDLAYGVGLMAMGIYQLFVRNRLRKFKTKSYLLLLCRYAFAVLSTVIYIIAASVATGLDQASSLAVMMICVNVALAIINRFYYKKRAGIFNK